MILGWMGRIAIVNVPLELVDSGRMPIGRRRGERKGCRNGGNGYKDAISVVWSIAITSVPSFRRGVTWSLGNRNPKTLLQPGDGRASAEKKGDA